jgi:hypothetical protein
MYMSTFRVILLFSFVLVLVIAVVIVLVIEKLKPEHKW